MGSIWNADYRSSLLQILWRGKNKILGEISVFKGSVKHDGPMDETKNR